MRSAVRIDRFLSMVVMALLQNSASPRQQPDDQQAQTPPGFAWVNLRKVGHGGIERLNGSDELQPLAECP
jgi:hypothetical protein